MVAGELKPKRLLPVVVVAAKDVLAKGELLVLDFGSFSFVFPVCATEVGAAEAEFGAMADPKLKTGAGKDVEKAGAGTDVEKTVLAAAVVVAAADMAVAVLAEVTLEELLLKSEFKLAPEAGSEVNEENIGGVVEAGVASGVLEFLPELPNEKKPLVDVAARAGEDKDSDFPNIFAAF